MLGVEVAIGLEAWSRTAAPSYGPHGEDVTADQAVNYFAARIGVHTREEAERLAFNR
jgi:hypothetical protein